MMKFNKHTLVGTLNPILLVVIVIGFTAETLILIDGISL
jgi:hypothetical protein